MKIPLYNPLNKDFSYTFFDDNNEEVTLVMKSLQVTNFKTNHEARTMLKHLADEVFFSGSIEVNPEVDMENIKKKIKLEGFTYDF